MSCVETGVNKVEDFHLLKKELENITSQMQNLVIRLQTLEEKYLAQQEALYVISEFASDWEYWQDENGNYKYVSPSCESVTGYKPEDFYAERDILKSIIAEEHWSRWQDHSHTLKEDDRVEPLEFEIITREGERKWIHHVCRTVTDSEGKNFGIRGSNRDITDIKSLQAKLRHVAGHDPLTGLPNRSLFLEHLQQNMKQANRQKSKFAVAFIDLDGFKEINDEYGHDAGDLVLKRVAGDLTEITRENDIISRFGGDEFVALFQVNEHEETKKIKQRIFDYIETEIVCYNYDIIISYSVGMAVYPDEGTTPDALLKYADTAMYAMKVKNKAQRKKTREQ